MATLTNTLTGQTTKVWPTCYHPSASYSQPVWVDADNNAYLQYGLEHLQPLYILNIGQFEKLCFDLAIERQQQGINVRQLASLAGVNKDTVTKFERGECTIPTADKIALALKSALAKEQ